MNKLQPHEQRVVDEHSELSLKINDLRNFILKNKKFYEISTYEQHLLVKQEHTMTQYAGLLEQRIGTFTR